MLKRFVIIVLGAGALIGISQFFPEISVEYGKKSSEAASELGAAAIGGAFSAIDHNAQPFTDQQLLGRYSLLYFGFTYCPDICPSGLLVVAGALDALPNDLRQKVLPVFVTIDPARDTPAVMRQYVQNFHPQLVGLTGSEAQVASIAKAYKVYYSKVQPEDLKSPYLMDHSGYFYLMDPEGHYLAHFPQHTVSTQALAEALRSHMLGS